MNFKFLYKKVSTVTLFGLLVFFIPFFVYFVNLHPTIDAGDSGELVTAAYYLGIPHPPGYPLFCLLGKLFIILIPFGEIAWRVNVMSAFLGALTGVFLFLTFIELFDNQIVAFGSALLFCFSRQFFGEALHAEVYTMNVLFAVLLIFIALKWQKTYKKLFFYLLAFFGGMGVVAHQTILMVLPVMFFWAIFLGVKNKTIWLKEIVYFSLMFFLGLSFYLYLPIRAMANPVLNWGLTDKLFNFFSHVLRVQYYGINATPRNLVNYLIQVFNYLKILSLQWPLVFFALVGVGLVHQFEKDVFRSLMFIGCFIFSSFLLIFFTNYDVNSPLQVETQRVFYLVSFIFISIWMGLGLSYVVFKLEELFMVRKSIVFIFILMLVISQVYFSLPQNNQSRNFIAYDYGKNILKSCKKDSILWVTGDVEVFSVCYLKLVEGLRPDITIYDSKRIVFGDQYGFLIWPIIGLMRPSLDILSKIENLTHKMGKPVYYGWYKKEEEMGNYWLIPNGLVYRVFPKGKKYRPPENFLEIYKVRGIWENTIPKDFLDEEICEHYKKTLMEYWMVELGKAFLERGEIEKAKEFFLKASNAAPDYVGAYEGLVEVAKKIGNKKLLDDCQKRIALIKKEYNY